MSLERSGMAQLEWPWPEAMDALTAAPEHHTVLMENEQVRVVQTRIQPGEIVPVHTHRWPSVLTIVAWSDLVRRDHLGNVTLDTRLSEEPALNAPSWREPLPPHSVENVGRVELVTVQVEIKGGAAGKNVYQSADDLSG